MTDALERAARAVRDHLTGTQWHRAADFWVTPSDNDAARALCQNAARAALLAFLDADEAMVEKAARAIYNKAPDLEWIQTNPGSGHSGAPIPFEQSHRTNTHRNDARAAIAALREMLEEKK